MEGRTLLRGPSAPEAFWYPNAQVEELLLKGYKKEKTPADKKAGTQTTGKKAK